MANVKIVAFAGSVRAESFNRKVLAVAVNGAKRAGAEVTVVDLKDFPLPVFNEDLEKSEGLPAKAQALKALMLEHRGLLIASPEYNSSITPLLKNTLDWVSRKAPGEESLSAYKDKIAGLVSASPGALGALRSMTHLRGILENLNVLVIPEQVAVGKAGEAFNPDGTLKDPKQQAAVEKVGERLVRIVERLL